MHHTRRPTKHFRNAILRTSQKHFSRLFIFGSFVEWKTLIIYSSRQLIWFGEPSNPICVHHQSTSKKRDARKKQHYYLQRHASSRFDVYTASSAIRVRRWNVCGILWSARNCRPEHKTPCSRLIKRFHLYKFCTNDTCFERDSISLLLHSTHFYRSMVVHFLVLGGYTPALHCKQIDVINFTLLFVV